MNEFVYIRKGRYIVRFSHQTKEKEERTKKKEIK